MVICCIEVCCSIWRSDKRCCLCLKVRNSIKWIHCVDILEALLWAAALYWYTQLKQLEISFVPWVFLLVGNVVPIALRLMGFLFRICGG